MAIVFDLKTQEDIVFCPPPPPLDVHCTCILSIWLLSRIDFFFLDICRIKWVDKNQLLKM